MSIVLDSTILEHSQSPDRSAGTTSRGQALRIKESVVALTLAFLPTWNIPNTWPSGCARDRKGSEIMIHCDRLFLPFSVPASHPGMAYGQGGCVVDWLVLLFSLWVARRGMLGDELE